MEYFILKNNGGEPKVTGIRNGTAQSWFSDFFFENNQEIKNFMWPDDKSDTRFIGGIKPEFDLDLIGLPMNKSAKHTDLIKMGALLSGCIISDKFRSLLENFHLPPHVYYRVSFNQPDKKTNEIKEVTGYWYLYFEKETGEKTIDFKRSTFDSTYHTKHLNLDIKDLKVYSYEDYMNIYRKTGKMLAAKTLKFSQNFDKGLDLWECKLSSSKIYISDRLREAMEANKITNIDLVSESRARRTAKLTNGTYCELVFE